MKSHMNSSLFEKLIHKYHFISLKLKLRKLSRRKSWHCWNENSSIS